MSHYISTNRSKHYLKCHLILVTKYRRNILVGQLNDDLKSIFSSIADNSDFEIEVFESDVNHIHFLIRYIPRLSVSQIVRRINNIIKLTIKINKTYPKEIIVCCHHVIFAATG